LAISRRSIAKKPNQRMEKIEGTPEKNGDPSKIASYSAGVNALVASGKAILAWLSGSSALLADAIHGFSDTFASLLVLVGSGYPKENQKLFHGVFTKLRILSPWQARALSSLRVMKSSVMYSRVKEPSSSAIFTLLCLVF